ncbi:cytochrome P450 [Mycena albidolilacea]|uniref:Cytochrome P450 n=1 Tax=Mycena albidolilacea TaxID=1033008 RepID=A0AAD7A9K1_9AGAR|nr:cytochrome P450 [Mycena albidolilacea]
MSSEDMITAWWLLCLAFVPILYLRWRRSLPFPPGPRKLPLIGNLLVMPSYCQWEVYAQWSKELDSDIIHLAVPGASIIILSSIEAAKDLLDKRSAIYSDRPRLAMFHDLMGGDMFFGFGQYGNIWRTHRRLSHRALDGAAANRFQPQTLKAAHDLLRRLLEKPEAFAEHFDHVVGANMISVAYGLDVAPSGDPFLDAGDAVLDILQETLIPGRFLVNTIPILRYVPSWVPGAGFKRQAAQWKKEMEEHVDQPFQAAKRNMNDGLIRPSFTMDNLRSLDGSADDDAREEDIKNVAGSIYAAGKDTTRFALRVFVRGILENPEAQKKAQEEIDAVVRPGHLPDFADEADLPWVTACVKETLRWWPILPLGLTRFIGVEDVYRGYRIPAGSYVMPNAWAMLQDETVYPDPEAFKPERFLLDGKLNPAVRDPDASFGFGRRVCAGKDMAWNTLWITVASMLATFEISKATTENGEVIEPPPGHTSEILDCPLPFECSIKPRSKAAEELIRAI